MKKILFLLPIVFLFLIPHSVWAKSYSITNANIDVTIDKTGSTNITETRTYDFSGSYSWADEWINLIPKCSGCANYYISKATVSENGRELVSQISNYGNKFYIKWYYSAFNEARTFNFSYTVNNALTNDRDVSEFYWQLIGDAWTLGTNQVNATVHLPDGIDGSQIQAFGHGPLNGIVKIVDNKTVTFSATSLPTNKFFEVRIVFPKLSGAYNAQTGNKTLSQILSEEKGFQQNTKNEQVFSYGKFVLLFSLPLFAILSLIYWIIRWFQIGRDRKMPVANLANSLHEPPSDMPPVLVETLLSFSHKPTGKSISATILNMIRKKAITLRIEKQGMLLGLFQKPDKVYFEKADHSVHLDKYEEKLLDLIFIDGDMIDIDSVKKIGRLHPTEAKEFYDFLQKEPIKDLGANDIIDPISIKAHDRASKEAHLFTIGGFVVFYLTLKIGILSGGSLLILVVAFGIVFVCGLLLHFVSNLIFRMTRSGNEEASKWIAFKHFLDFYDVTKGSVIGDIVLWEKYLVYGTVLGISKKVLETLKLNTNVSTSGSPLYGFVYINGNSNFSNSFNSFSTNFASFGASGIGSSGGFSGGGGGGGGGGGAG